uniref:Uncharacterized protein n=1 Tax=Lepeophtheirus salmonis TaxID=72036 RepID=A0A0K2V6G7_LEPSM
MSEGFLLCQFRITIRHGRISCLIVHNLKRVCHRSHIVCENLTPKIKRSVIEKYIVGM